MEQSKIIMLGDKGKFGRLLKEWASLFPEAWEAALSSDEPDPRLMDRCYKVWIKHEKKAGKIKKRHIAAVKDETLKLIHTIIYEDFKLPVHSNVFSYKTGTSTVDCARRHVGYFSLFKMDIVDFFPSTRRSFIEDLYTQFLLNFFSEKKARTLGRFISILCSKSDSRKVIRNEAVLPIGIAPASNISNAVLLPLDILLSERCQKEGYVYSRYSDNLYISAGEHIPREFQTEIRQMMEQFTLSSLQPYKSNRSKERYCARWRQQRVLGIVVNEVVNLPRGREKWIRSALNHLFQDARDLDSRFATLDKKQRSTSLMRLSRKLRKVGGMLSYTNAVRSDKYLHYSSALNASRILIEDMKARNIFY